MTGPRSGQPRMPRVPRGLGEPRGISQLRHFAPKIGAGVGASGHAGGVAGAGGPSSSEAEVLDFVLATDAANLVREVTFRRLAELVRVADPVPHEVITAAKQSFTWRTIDEDLARLVYDSTLDGDLLAGVRAGGTVGRQLTFQASEFVLEVEVMGGLHREMTCQVVPSQPATLEVRHRSGSMDLERDEYGLFHFTSVPAGPVSLRCAPLEGSRAAATTSWITF